MANDKQWHQTTLGFHVVPPSTDPCILYSWPLLFLQHLRQEHGGTCWRVGEILLPAYSFCREGSIGIPGHAVAQASFTSLKYCIIANWLAIMEIDRSCLHFACKSSDQTSKKTHINLMLLCLVYGEPSNMISLSYNHIFVLGSHYAWHDCGGGCEHASPTAHGVIQGGQCDCGQCDQETEGERRCIWGQLRVQMVSVYTI